MNQLFSTPIRILPLIALALILLPACQPSTPPDVSANPPIRVSAYYWPSMYWVDIANKKGWFKEAGLNVEAVDTNANFFASFDDFFRQARYGRLHSFRFHPA